MASGGFHGWGCGFSVLICASVLWGTKHTKDHEKHETLSRLSLLLASFMVQTFHHPNLPLRQPIQLVHQRVNLPVHGFDLAQVELHAGGDGDGGQIWCREPAKNLAV